MKKIKFMLTYISIVAVCLTTLFGCKTAQTASTPDEADTTVSVITEETTVSLQIQEGISPSETDAANSLQKDTAYSSDKDDVDNAVSSDLKNPGTCIITLENGNYTAEVGDIITYNYYLKTPKKIENVQAIMNYSGRSLKILNQAIIADPEKDLPENLYDDVEKAFPVLGDSVVYNGSNQNLLKFNATSVSGYDFTKGEYLITVEFEVISEISGYISTSIEMMDEIGGTPYVDNYTFADNVIHEESLTV